METLHPSEIDLGLDRIKQVASRLTLEKPQAKIITVAGTNGKGSCIRTLERALVARGRKVGAYTSPHICRYNERIRIAEKNIDDAALCQAFTCIERARRQISLTYFEFGTLAALLIFAAQDLDYWLLEVGLGGRLDAVNILPPDYAVITSIDLDHENWLGDTREKIAAEKLGILRHGISCVCADTRPTENMEDIFHALRVKCYRIGREFTHSCRGDQMHLRLRDCAGGIVERTIAPPNLPRDSIAAAMQVLSLCGELAAKPELDGAMRGLGLPGRFESIVLKSATVILDVAHNPAAVEHLRGRLAKCHGRPVYAVVGMLADKQIGNTLRPLVGLVDRWMVSGFAGVARSASSEHLAAILLDLGVADADIERAQTVAVALRDTIAVVETASNGQRSGTVQEGPIILVFGSFFAIASAHEFLSGAK